MAKKRKKMRNRKMSEKGRRHGIMWTSHINYVTS